MPDASFSISRPFVRDGQAVFSFTCPTFGAFEETVDFGLETIDPTSQSLMQALAVAIGVSYYKAAAVGALALDFATTPALQAMTRALYTEGLGEFYVRNDLPYPPQIDFHFDDDGPASVSRRAQPQPASVLCAFGGGKDSHVSAGLLRAAGIEPKLISVVLSQRVADVLATMTADPITFIHRRIDPKLIKLNKSGDALNGHVPITAINSLILALQAHLMGETQIVFSNERGASQATRFVNDHPVNHQFSKSMGFERILQQIIAEASDGALSYFSLLRGASELWIAKTLARDVPEAWPYVASCNRNFVFDPAIPAKEAPRWCLECSKCVYTALILAPHLSPKYLVEIFGGNPFDNQANETHLQKLTLMGDEKPWECVGDYEDSRAVLRVLVEDTNWKSCPAIAALADKIGSLISFEDATRRITKQIASFEDDLAPDWAGHLLRQT